ncbi:hypothetical protein PV327_001597 [Microctonus hyperodae]|uniref:Transcription factor Adf-1 n=1 Tax=Microctonus hyperodae TaxID=165561 RepID=A0AA39KN81_MICHY|nr:hypothetical protein PV327_001597 [Microctonus hyperodae]
MKEEIKVDAKLLIAEVYKRSALWNQRDVLYHNRDVTNRIWTELSAVLGPPKAILKAKWKGLRDTFRAEIKKEQFYQKNDYPRSNSVWIHYKRLQFLKEQMLPRPPIWERENCNEHLHNKNDRETTSLTKNRQVSRIGIKIKSGKKNAHSNGGKDVADDDNLSLTLLRNDNCNDDIKKKSKKSSKSKSLSLTSFDQKNESHVHNPLPIIESTQNTVLNNTDDLSNELQTIIVKHEPVEDITENIEFENDILPGSSTEDARTSQTVSSEYVINNNIIDETRETQLTFDPFEGNCLDDNYYFLMSLLPHIKTLPPERRMLLRMQMQELVYKEVYKKNNSVDS